MTTSNITICVISVMLYLMTTGIIALFLCEEHANEFSGREKAFAAICWPLVIILLPVFYIIKIIKQHNKLKETNKIEEDKRKKELVDNVLKELNIR